MTDITTLSSGRLFNRVKRLLKCTYSDGKWRAELTAQVEEEGSDQLHKESFVVYRPSKVTKLTSHMKRDLVSGIIYTLNNDEFTKILV